MRILAFSDTHGDTDFSHLEPHARQADLILCAGDITDWAEDGEDVLAALQRFADSVGKDVVLTHGNHDGESLRELAVMHPRLRYVHQSLFVSDGVAVLGYGGGGFSSTDPLFERFIESAHKHKDVQGKLIVWLMHGPPHDLVVDTIPGWGPTGCKSKRKMIERHAPHIVVSGHIHEAEGVVHEHGRTLLVNPGPSGVLIEIEIEAD